MITNGKTLTLDQGPSREKLFDAVRLGGQHKKLRTLEFWTVDGGTGCLERVEIEAIALADGTGNYFSFWGKTYYRATGDIRAHVYGVWNTGRRTGMITFGETTFLVAPTLEL